MAINIACCARQYQPDVEPYESSVIRRVVGLTLMNANLSLSAYFGPLERWRFFWGCLAVMFLTAVTAEIGVALPPHRAMDSILRICRDSLDAKSYPWMEAVARPYVSRDRIPITCTAVILYVAWVIIWIYLRRALSRQRCLTQPCTTTLRYALVVFFVLTLGIFTFAVYWLAVTTRTHICLTYAPRKGPAEETQWGVGQIVAPFAWANLAIDVTYEVTQSLACTLRRLTSVRTVAGRKGGGGERVTVPHQTVRGISTQSEAASLPESGYRSPAIETSLGSIPSRPSESVAQPPKAHYPLLTRHPCKCWI